MTHIARENSLRSRPQSDAPARKPRRSQAQRSNETRARVIDAAAACICEKGLVHTNLRRIASRAQVTPGAIQHQFGDKAAVLYAVVEQGFEELTRCVATTLCVEMVLETRVAAFVDALAEGYAGPYTRASLEILLGMRSHAAFRQRSLSFFAGIRATVDRIWMGSFFDAPASRAQHIEAQRLIFTTLNGQALEGLLLVAGPEAKKDLERLKERVLDLITQH